MKPRTPFQPLDEDLDNKIETLARDKGVGAMVKPVQAEQGPAVSRTAPTAIVTTPMPPRGVAASPNDADFDAAHARTPMKTLNVELPDYVWTALKIRAAERKTSVRHVIMTGLRNEGISIAETDMADASRRIRGGHRGRSGEGH